MKLIDADKLDKWLKGRIIESKNLGAVHAYERVRDELITDRFDPTPPVQPDTEELSQEDIKELSDMFKNIESSCVSIAGHLKGMNNTLDRFGEVITDDQPTKEA